MIKNFFKALGTILKDVLAVLAGSSQDNGVTPAPIPIPTKEGDKPVAPVPTKGKSTVLNPDFEELAAMVDVDPEQDKRDYLKSIVLKILNVKKRYQAVEETTKVPWKLIAAIHFKEASLNFACMLHNGEPLNIVSRIVPKGVGPFKTWEASAIDSLNREGSDKVKFWTLAAQLEFAESYNGLGYRKRGIYSPYVFGFTNLSQEKGGYPKDHVWDANYVYKRPGVAALILALDYAEGTTRPMPTTPNPLPTTPPHEQEEMDFYKPDIKAREYVLPSREQMLAVANGMIEGQIKVKYGPLDTIRETMGRNRDPRIDGIILSQGGELAQPYCAYGAQYSLDEKCAFYGIPRKLVRIKEGGGTQSLWAFFKEKMSNYIVESPVICGWVIWYYDSSTGHIGESLGVSVKGRFPAFEYNTDSSDGDNIVRDGQGAGRTDRQTAPTGNMKLRGYIDVYKIICEDITTYRASLGLETSKPEA